MISPKNVGAFHRSLRCWYRHHGRDLSWRKTHDPYAILVSEFMLQQTRVATVIPYYNEWLRRFPDVAALARASQQEVLHAWQGLGYYARARNLHATARAIVDRRHGAFPQSVEEMQRLPGIGKYTAHAIASFAFNQPVPILEANTARVLTRLLDFRGAINRNGNRERLWQNAAALVSKHSGRIYNSALTDLGAIICMPRRPRCTICPVQKFCQAKNPEALPNKKARPRMRRLTENHALIVRPQRILLQKALDRWRGMWILPPLQTRPVNRRPIYKSNFPFTNHRVAFNVYPQRRRKIHRLSQRWMRIDSLDSIPIPSPHRRAVRHLLSESTAAPARRQQSLGS